MIRAVAMALLHIAAACASQPPPPPPADLVIIAPRMLDVRAGTYLENRAVIIRDGRIAAIASPASASRLSAKERLTLRIATTARVRRARELGVPIVFGTDATVLPHGENARELASLLAAGLTPIEAIRAATIDAAKLIGWQTRVGSIEPGYEADLIVVGNDVLTTLTPLDVKAVIARGRIVRNELAQ